MTSKPSCSRTNPAGTLPVRDLALREHPVAGNECERESIWQLVITRHGRDPEQFDLTQLARITDGFTGSEIEAAFTEALFLAFAQDREPSDLDIAKVLTEFVPLSKQMADQINGLRQWAKGRARPATSPVAPERRLRKLTA